VLAEYGAEVVKVNNPDNSNPAAGTGHLFVNSGKRTILVNLRQPEGLELVHRLVADADVFSENFVQGTAERLGIGESQLREVRPDLVYSSVSAHARGGYRGHHRGHEELGQAVTGMEMRYGDDHPRRQGFPVCDFSTGHLTALGIVLALFDRLRTGRGQSVQTALSRSATMLQAQYMVAYEGREWTEPRGVEQPGEGPLYRLYSAADRLIFLAAAKEDDRVRLASVDGLHGVDKLSDAELETFLAERLATDTAHAWVSRLQEAGIGAHEVREVQENMLHPLTDARRLSVLREHDARGPIRSVGRWGRFSATPLQEPFPASPLGWHTREIAEELGYGDRLEELLERGALATALRESIPAQRS
jgi:crotonobetainyl-CoA:carnitine CoA-transferase CaiB-like acyl-CoA transferase